ncbi:hypothetical protein PCASD_24033, partial [Puccinia coronata f. sp. avenae]
PTNLVQTKASPHSATSLVGTKSRINQDLARMVLCNRIGKLPELCLNHLLAMANSRKRKQQ